MYIYYRWWSLSFVPNITKVSLLYSYCSSLYGCELWDLSCPQLSAIGVSWRKALKRLWQLPLGTHAHILYALCGKWSIEHEICRRSLHFALSCIYSGCSVIRDVMKFILMCRPAQSVICRNLLFLCNSYNLSMSELSTTSYNAVKMVTSREYFMKFYFKSNANTLSSEHLNLLFDCLFIRNNVFKLSMKDQQLQDTMCDIILFICTS